MRVAPEPSQRQVDGAILTRTGGAVHEFVTGVLAEVGAARDPSHS